MVVLRYGLYYFLLVFCVGFALGLVRVPFLEPALGIRWAELIETPFMWLACYWAAGVVIRSGRLPGRSVALQAGVFALVLMLAAEFSVVLGLRDMTLAEWFASRDVVAGPVYGVSLVWFALAPWWRVHRRMRGQGNG
jgi:hypothetical protein